MLVKAWPDENQSLLSAEVMMRKKRIRDGEGVSTMASPPHTHTRDAGH